MEIRLPLLLLPLADMLIVIRYAMPARDQFLWKAITETLEPTHLVRRKFQARKRRRRRQW